MIPESLLIVSTSQVHCEIEIMSLITGYTWCRTQLNWTNVTVLPSNCVMVEQTRIKRLEGRSDTVSSRKKSLCAMLSCQWGQMTAARSDGATVT
jgi:hypothetical protein